MYVRSYCTYIIYTVLLNDNDDNDNYYYTDITITNGPQDTTVCMNTIAKINCGYTGANPVYVIPKWQILLRSDNGSIISNSTINGEDIYDTTINGLQWVPDLRDNNASNSKLLVGPVNKTHNQSSYQCIIITLLVSSTIKSSVGTITVVGKATKAYVVTMTLAKFSCNRSTISYDQCG